MKKTNKSITALVCVSLLFSCLSTLSGCQDSSSEANLSTTLSEVYSSESSENENRVVFYSDEGIILGKDDVPQGGTPATPAQGLSKEGYVFTGWGVKPGSVETEDAGDTDKTTSANNAQDGDQTLPQIDEDTDFEANYIDIRDKSNVFALPAVYGKCGETIETNLQLCGKVELCAFDIQIIYDPKVLEFSGFSSQDDDVIANCDKENGIIRANFTSSSNATGSIALFNIIFRIIAEKTAVAELTLKAVEVVKVEVDKSFSKPEYTLISGKIYISGGTL